MQHIPDDDLVLTYYGEESGAAQHLRECAECRLRFQALQRTLNVVEWPVPERGASYEADVWTRLEPKLGRLQRRLAWLAPRYWLAAAAMASVALAAIVAGRFLPGPVPPPVELGSFGNERVLVREVGDHLERTQFVLAELLNSENPADPTRARTLVDANRLYRAAAAAGGDAGVALLLDDLERVLLELAHSPAKPSSEELDALRERVRAQSLLFKIRVLGARLKQEAQEPLQLDHKL